MKVPKSTQLPSGKWFVRLRLNGNEYAKTFDTQKEADAWALATKAQYKAGQLEQKKDAEQKTIRQLTEEYLNDNILSPSTIRSFRTTINNHFGQIMDKPYCEIRNWQKVVNLELRTISPNSLFMYWQRINCVLRYHGLPTPTIKIKKTALKQKNYLTPDEIKRFEACIYGHRFEALYLMMLSSMRVSEAIAVRKEDITKAGIHVRGTKSAAADRMIPWMIPRLEELCKDYKPVKIKNMQLNTVLHQICADNGFDDMSCHSLRVSFASLCYSQGIPERVAMKIGGWSNLTTMHNHYVKIAQDDVDRYVKQLRDMF